MQVAKPTLSYLSISAILVMGFGGRPAAAQMAVHPVILDMSPNELQRADLEVENTSAERMYVQVEPSLIVSPGSKDENRLTNADPEQLGLLTSPPRLIVEPGERRFVRVAALGPPGEQDRIFRVTVKPVVGDITGDQTGLKIMVGYDVLVIQRPAKPSGDLVWEDQGTTLVIRNKGNSNVQLANGTACLQGQVNADCAEVPSQRLYAGNELTVAKTAGQIVTYDILFMGKTRRQIFK